MGKDINKTAFDQSTKLKLSIFGECFEEWFPVFLHSKWYKELYIFDFFAGSGKDIEDTNGSPLVLLDKAKGLERKYCLKAAKPVKFFFNEFEKEKFEELSNNILQYISRCSSENNCKSCTYQYQVENYDFQNIFSNDKIKSIFKNKDFGKFILLDQYGFSQIDEQIFKQLTSFPKTDFIFFISSSFISRFREHPNTTKYFDTSKIPFDQFRGNEIHRAIADYFRDLIASNKEYYVHHFTIQKEQNKGNYYGLIFGSNHTLGMEKFLKVCWKHDPQSGEANFNIDNNFESGTLFHDPVNSVKKDIISYEIREGILSGKIRDNITGLEYCLKNGCEPRLFTEVVRKLEKEKHVELFGDVNSQSSNIHKVKRYSIKIN